MRLRRWFVLLVAAGVMTAQQSETNGEAGGNISSANNVVGMAVGDRFLINGSVTPSNANLMKGMRVQALDKPVTLYLRDNCECLLAPKGEVTLNTKLVMLENGSVRLRRFGNCRVLYGGLFVIGQPTSDGVAALHGQSLEVASVSGPVSVVNGAGDLISQLDTGKDISLAAATTSSGASIGGKGPRGPIGTKVLLGGAMAAALASLGLSIDAIVTNDQGAPSGTSPTSR